MGNLSPSIALCQVHGCKKDLSSFKEYHKRHKVCEVHSKTAKVIVNGVEQRFCQQCSRFHWLAEFDDGKRSCRKHLAGHNERRRKSHVRINSRINRSLYQLYDDFAGSRFQGTMVTKSSFICQDILPSSLLHQQYEKMDCCMHIKLEDGAAYCPQSAISVLNGQPQPQSFFPSNGHEKHSAPPHQHVNNTTAGSETSAGSKRYPHDKEGSNIVTSIGGEGFIVFDSASNVKGSLEISDYGRALSLLSTQPQNSSTHASRDVMTHPLIIPGSHARYSLTQGSEKLFGLSPQASTNGVPNIFNSSSISSVDKTYLDCILVSDGSNPVKVEAVEIFQGSEYMATKDRLGPPIELLHLSSQLQQVEHQRPPMQVNPKNDPLCGLRVT